MPSTKSKTLGTDFELPVTPDGAVGKMMQFADIFGAETTFEFLGLLHGNTSPLGDVRALLAAQMIIDEMRRQPDLMYRDARLTVARRFGYTRKTYTNFNKIAGLGRHLMLQAGKWTIPQDKDNA